MDCNIRKRHAQANKTTNRYPGFRPVMQAMRLEQQDPRYPDYRPEIVLDIDGETIRVTPEELLNDEQFVELQDSCNDADTRPEIRLRPLLGLSDKERVVVLDFVANLQYRPLLSFESGGTTFDDLLTAVLDAPVAKEVPGDLMRLRTAALQVVALQNPDVLETACAQIAMRLKELGEKGVRTDWLVREAKTIAKQLAEAASVAEEAVRPRLVRTYLVNAPVPPTVRVPCGWQLSEAGVRRSSDDAKVGMAAPVVICGRGKDCTKGTEHVCLAWFSDGRWQRRIVEREIVASTQKIVALAAYGVETVPCAAVFVPTQTGTTGRMISRFNPAVWIVALNRDERVCQGLAFSYGVHAEQLAEDPVNWQVFAENWLRKHQLPGAVAMLVAGPSARNPSANHRIEFLRVDERLRQP